MKNSFIAAGVLLALCLGSAVAPAKAEVIQTLTQPAIITQSATILNTNCEPCAVGVCPPGFPAGLYARSADYGPDFYVGYGCASYGAPAAAVLGGYSY